MRKLLYSLKIILLLSLVLILPTIHTAATIGAITASTVETHGAGMACWGEHRTFYSNYRYWAFYYDIATGFHVFESSSDGLTWTGKTNVISTTSTILNVWIDNLTVHVAYNIGGVTEGIGYRMGTCNSDGTITWAAAWQTIDAGKVSGGYFSICTDANGYPWVAYIEKTSGHIEATKSSTKDGTWTNAVGHPLELYANDCETNNPPIIVPLTSGKMYCIWSDVTLPLLMMYGAEYDGAAWGAQQTVSNNEGEYHKSVVAYGDEVFVTWREIGIANSTIHFASRSALGVWSPASHAATALGLDPDWSNTTLSVDETTGNLYIMWSDLDDNVYYKLYTYSTSTWDVAGTVLVDETIDDTMPQFISASYDTNGKSINVIYETTPATPIKIRHSGYILVSNEPSNLEAQPLDSTRIKLTWTHDTVFTTVALYRKQAGYPTSPADIAATKVYQGTLQLFIDNNLEPGTTYYYRIWSLLAPGIYSPDYASDYATTMLGGAISEDVTTPSDWFQVPVCTAYSNIPFLYSLIGRNTAAWNMPIATGCVMVTFGWIIALSGLVRIATHTNMLTLIGLMLFLGVAIMAQLLPAFFWALELILGGFTVFIWRRV